MNSCKQTSICWYVQSACLVSWIVCIVQSALMMKLEWKPLVCSLIHQFITNNHIYLKHQTLPSSSFSLVKTSSSTSLTIILEVGNERLETPQRVFKSNTEQQGDKNSEQWWLLTASLRPQGQVACALVVHQLGVHPLTGQGAPGGRHPWTAKEAELQVWCECGTNCSWLCSAPC